MGFEFTPEIANKLKRLDECGASLEMEASIARYLLEECVEKGGNVGLGVALLNCIPKIVSAQIQNDIRMATMLPATSVLQIARGIIGALAARLEAAAVPNRDEIMAGLMSDIQGLFARVKEQRLLTNDTRRNQE